MIVLITTFGGALLGMWLRAVMPARYFDAESRETVKVGIGLIATMTALVLGLVTASAKKSFDDVSTEMKGLATQTLALDRALARDGPETAEIRKELKQLIGTRIDMIWPQEASRPVNIEPIQTSGEALAQAIRRLTPTDDSQRALQGRALDLAEAVLQNRWIVTTSAGASVPWPFLSVLVFWLTITFMSFGLMGARNAMVVSVLLLCALSVAAAVFLVLEMDGPFEGLLRVSPAPLRSAYEHLNQ